MARKVVDWAAGSGRDAGKVFRITEMPAFRAEKWAIKALQALMSTGVELPDDINDAPAANLVRTGLKALAAAPFDVVEPLLDEMLTCIKLIPDPARANVERAVMWDIDVEEAQTIIMLRKEVLDIHLGFFTGE
jgi:hypothetical protein